MSYECWRAEVALGRMADWDEDRRCYGPAPDVSSERTIRVWDRQMKCWTLFHWYLPFDAFTGANPRYSRTEEQ